jgi:hypothetical protein
MAIQRNSGASVGPIAVCLLATTVLVSPAAANLLTNGGAESGVLDPWAATGGQIEVVTQQDQQAGTVLPFAGDHFFTFAHTPGTLEEMYQTGTAGLDVGATLVLTGMVQTEDMEDDDYGVATIRILDAADAELAVAATDPLVTPNLTWQSFSASVTVPEGAVRWEIRLRGQRLHGTYINVFWDALDLDSGISPVEALPCHAVVLHQNHPNPFNPQTTITFALDRPQQAEVAVYDLTGRMLGVLADRSYSAGDHSVVWNGKDAMGRAVPSGTYVVRLSTETDVQSRKVMLLR